MEDPPVKAAPGGLARAGNGADATQQAVADDGSSRISIDAVEIQGTSPQLHQIRRCHRSAGLRNADAEITGVDGDSAVPDVSISQVVDEVVGSNITIIGTQVPPSGSAPR